MFIDKFKGKYLISQKYFDSMFSESLFIHNEGNLKKKVAALLYCGHAGAMPLYP